MALEHYKLSTFGDTKRLLGLDDRLIDELMFTEKLYVFDENGKRIGRFSLKLDQDDSVKLNKKIFVHISNRAFIDGKLSESIVTGTVTTKLKTLEEIRYECSEVPNTGKHERSIFILREATKYYVSVTNTICDTKHRSHYTLPFVECILNLHIFPWLLRCIKFSLMPNVSSTSRVPTNVADEWRTGQIFGKGGQKQGMIGECSNAVLLRKLATRGYEGILCLKTILSNGKRCKSYYVTKLSEQIVNGKRMQVMVVYRNITNCKKLNITMTLVLTRAGQLIYLFWSNSKCFLHIDPDCEINPRRFTYAEPPFERHWNKDVQLHSLYLDKVSTQCLVYRTHKYQNDPLRRILRDFLQYVLLKKPPNIICFAKEYFTLFGHNTKGKCPSDLKIPTEDFDYYSEKQEPEENYWPQEEFYFLESPQ